MKLLACDRCLDVVPLAQGLRSCSCGNVAGRYLVNDDDIQVHVRDESAARVIGLPNDVRYGRSEREVCYVIPWTSPKVRREYDEDGIRQ
jgi:hypothetical protein